MLLNSLNFDFLLQNSSTNVIKQIPKKLLASTIPKGDLINIFNKLIKNSNNFISFFELFLLLVSSYLFALLLLRPF